MSKEHVYKVPALTGNRVFTTEAGAKAAIRDAFKRAKRIASNGSGQHQRQLERFPVTIDEFDLAETERVLSWPPEEEL